MNVDNASKIVACNQHYVVAIKDMQQARLNSPIANRREF